MNLITGATGLVGAHVALQLLQQKKTVVAIRRSTSDINKTKKLFSYYSADYEQLFQKIKWIDADICDIYSILDALEGIKTVYHCAGFVSFNKKDHKQLYKTNTEGTANIVNACLEKKIETLCYVSTIATLQNPDISKNINESVYWKSSPHASDYAISKYNGEREVWRGIEEGLNAIIVNPSIILGPGFWNQSSGNLFSTCYKGTSFYTSGSSAIINAIDVANCMISLVDKNLIGKRYILSASNNSFLEISTAIQKKFNKKTPHIPAGKTLLKLATWADSVRCLLTGNKKTLSASMIHSLLEENTYNNERIKKALDFEFTPFLETITFICEAYLSDIKKQ
jgi:nucleoside-diphosphate-sugar epimerase